MLYHNRQELLKILDRENLYTQKNLGQNFLFNPAIIDQIITAAKLSPSDRIIEVGPGLGLLTQELLETAAQVTTIELDQKLIPYLQKTFARFNNLEILNKDVLKFIPPSTPYKLIANIPYYITSPILSHFLQVKPPSVRPTLMILLVQLEVAQKICAKTGDHTVLSLQTKIFAKPSIIDKVSAGNFLPAPKVDSAILKLEVLPQPLVQNPALFITLIKKAFSQKRKTLLNSLQTFHNLDKTAIASILEKVNISPLSRPQNLSIEELERICLQISAN